MRRPKNCEPTARERDESDVEQPPEQYAGDGNGDGDGETDDIVIRRIRRRISVCCHRGRE
jgi:hypothetical protein